MAESRRFRSVRSLVDTIIRERVHEWLLRVDCGGFNAPPPTCSSPGTNLDLVRIRDDLTPRSLIAHVSHDDLWAALEQLNPIDDPFSLLGIVDLAVSCSGDNERFATLAAQTVERLCGAQLCRDDGLDVYAFLPALLHLVQAELRIAPSIASCPAYWRRICAWTQVALLVRAFQRVSFDAEQFSENTKPLIVAEAATAEFLDLRRSPLSYPAETSRICIRAEVLGRLLVLQKRETEHGRKLPGAAALSEAVAEQAKSAPYLSQMPGPLELDRLPAWQMENLPEESNEFKSDLRRRANKLTIEGGPTIVVADSKFSRGNQL